MAQVRNVYGEPVYAGDPIGRLVAADEVVTVADEFLEGLVGTDAAPSAFWAPAGDTARPRLTVAAVLDEVDGDAGRAGLALAAEEASPHPRSTLVGRLQRIMDEG